MDQNAGIAISDHDIPGEGSSPRPIPWTGSRRALTGLTVLLVEDDASSREALELIFAFHGACVVGAPSAREALACYERTPPSILVTDIGLPDEDGCALLRAIRARELAQGRYLPAIAVSGFPSPAARSRAYRAGFDSFLSKPVEMDALLRQMVILTSRA